jgi:xanthomonalisin
VIPAIHARLRGSVLATAALVALSGISANATPASSSIAALSAAAAAAGASFVTIAPAITLRSTDSLGGAIAASQVLHVVVSLKLRNQAALDSFIATLAQPGTPVSSRAMVPGQFDAQHAPTAAQAQDVASYLQQAGFTNIEVAPNRLLVSADAPASTVESSFGTSISTVTTADNRQAFANTLPVQIPASLQDVVQSVIGLQSVYVPHLMSVPTVQSATTHDPVEFAAIYGATGVPVAAGVPIGILTEGTMAPAIADLSTFAVANGLPQVDTQVVVTHGSSTDNSGLIEWDLDTQDIVGMGGGVVGSLILYDMQSLLNTEIITAINRVVSDDATKIINGSLGECETGAQQDGSWAAAETIFQAAIANGQTFSFSTGDKGADECQNGHTTPSWPANSQYVVAVGGTTVDTTGTTYNSEAAWIDGGGSPSLYEPKPTWQNTFVTGTKRGLPDVAFDGDPASGALLYVGNSRVQEGGTSLSSPLFVGSWARLIAAHGNLGFAAPLLYQQLTSVDFHDVTTGNNGGETAGPGWDFTTGRGSFDLAQVNAHISTTQNTVAATVVTSFAPANVAVGASSTLTITLTNTNADAATLTSDLTDTFPAGLVAASSPNASTTCAGATATSTSDSVTLPSGAAIPAAGSCTVTISVTSAATGAYVNTIAAGALQTAAGASPAPATATLIVTAGGSNPALAANPNPIAMSVPAGSSQVGSLTVANIGGGTLAYHVQESASAPPSAPAGYHAPTQAASGSLTLGAGASSNAHGTAIVLGSSSISQTASNTPGAGGVSCAATDGSSTSDNSWWRRFYFSEYPQVGSSTNIQSVTITSGVSGPNGLPLTINLYTIPHSTTVNTIPTEALTLIGTGAGSIDSGLVTATIPVLGTVDDTVNKDLVVEWHTDGVGGGKFVPGSTTSTETHPTFISSAGCGITEPATSASIGVPTFHIVMVVNLGGNGAPVCQNASDVSWLSVTPNAGTLAAGASAAAALSVDATSLTAGNYSANLCLISNDPNSPLTTLPVNVTVTGGGQPGAPTIAKAFAPTSIAAGATSTLTITLSNGNASDDTLTADLTDTFPSGLVVASTPNASTTCSGGSGVTTSGGAVTLGQGAKIPATGTCTVSVDVTAANGGSFANTIAAGALQTDQGNNAVAANATLTVTGGTASSPLASVTPASISLTAAADSTASQTLTIADAAGHDPLTFSIASSTSAASKPQLVPHVAYSKKNTPQQRKAELTLASSRHSVSTQHDPAPWSPRSAAGDITFVVDDGSAEDDVGLNDAQSGGNESFAAIWVNRFTATGPLTIDSISVFWDSRSGFVSGLQANLVVYYDANATGDITNAVRLGDDDLVDIDTTQLNAFQNHTTAFNVPGAGDVYIGFVDEYALVAGGYPGIISPAAIDETPPHHGQSWVSGSSDGNTPVDLNDLANNDLTGTIDSEGIPGNWLIRATGGAGGGAPCTGPAVSWLSASPATGTVAGGSSTAVTVTATPATSSLQPGSYTADLCLTTNDPTQPLLAVPVTLTVTPATSTDPCSAAGTIFCDGFDGSSGGAYTQPVVDPGFEATTQDGGSNPNWQSEDTNPTAGSGATVFWSNDVGVPTHSGIYVAYFGGWGGSGAETQNFSQTVTFASAGPLYLNYWRTVGDAPDVPSSMVVSIDGTPVETTDFSTLQPDSDFEQQSIDVSTFADGAAHVIQFQYVYDGSGSSDGDVLVDDVSVDQSPISSQTRVNRPR